MKHRQPFIQGTYEPVDVMSDHTSNGRSYRDKSLVRVDDVVHLTSRGTNFVNGHIERQKMYGLSVNMMDLWIVQGIHHIFGQQYMEICNLRNGCIFDVEAHFLIIEEWDEDIPKYTHDPGEFSMSDFMKEEQDRENSEHADNDTDPIIDSTKMWD